jgi:hypothetical protein
MDKHTLRDDPKYVRIEKKWHDAYRRRDRAYDAHPSADRRLWQSGP